MGTQFVTISGFMTTKDVDAHPEHPIVIPLPPPGIWGGANEPFPTNPIVIPLPPVESGGVPTHPIYLPPGIWGPTDPRPTPPINIPPGQPPTGGQPPASGAHPEHPIYNPPGIWGPTDPRPTVPIYLPGPPPTEDHPRDEWSWAFSPYYGWIVLPPDTAARPKTGKK